METLTARQQEVLHFIQETQAAMGHPPTLREIAAYFQFRSMTAARDHVRALESKGVLETAPRRARSLRLLSSAAPAQPRRTIEAPIYGSIPAGYADARRQEKRGCVSIDIELLGIRPTARTFALEVRGDSMIGRHILDGDYVILEHGMTPRDGDVVAALIDSESTLKTFVANNGRPLLRAENPKYPKLYPAAELVIQGVMIGLVRKGRK